VVRNVKVRVALNRTECLCAFDGRWSEQRMAGENGDHARIEVKVNIPLNSRVLSKSSIMSGRDFRSHLFF
jgi:hypothetical protein